MHTKAITQKDKTIFEKIQTIKGFYLAGGTGLALQIGHRISVDFDLFSNQVIRKNFLYQIEKLFIGNNIEVSVNNSNELTLFINGVKVTFLYYPFPVLQPFVKYNSLPLLSIEEIAATKAYTIGRRGSFKDYVDMYFVLKDNYSTLGNITKLAERKYEEAFNARLFFEQLVYWEDVEAAEIVFLKTKVTRAHLENFFEKTIKNTKL